MHRDAVHPHEEETEKEEHVLRFHPALKLQNEGTVPTKVLQSERR